MSICFNLNGVQLLCFFLNVKYEPKSKLIYLFIKRKLKLNNYIGKEMLDAKRDIQINVELLLKNIYFPFKF